MRRKIFGLMTDALDREAKHRLLHRPALEASTGHWWHDHRHCRGMTLYQVEEMIAAAPPLTVDEPQAFGARGRTIQATLRSPGRIV